MIRIYIWLVSIRLVLKMNKRYIIFIALLVLIVSISSVSANNLNETDVISESNLDEGNIEIDDYNERLQVNNDNDDSSLGDDSTEVIVSNWNELQYYCSLNDNNYTLKLKENTNFYPNDPSDSSYQILIRNNVRIIGSEGSYIGDASSDFRNITYTAISVPDNSGVGITLENVTFKWIGTRYQADGVFLCMGGDVYNYIRNCYFTEISTNLGHSSILHIKWGDAVVENCTFVNCTTDFGCISIYNPKDDATKLCTRARMELTDCYFEGNFARTEPGCINNCGVLIVRNSTFYKNSAGQWAGAIHTHGGANTTIYDSNFTDNLAGWNGGALYTYSYLQIYNSIFKGNNCTTNNGGGAIGACKYLHSPFIYINECTFEDNENKCWGLDELSTTGTGRGGAISIMDDGGIEVYNSTFIRNSASIGSAICAIAQGNYGSPNVVIVGNKFYNHTRIGDVLNVVLSGGSTALIDDNYFYNNSIVFSKLRLVINKQVDNEAALSIQATLENPSFYDADILDKSEYDIYVDGKFVKRVNATTFTLNFEDNKVSSVYAIPCISTSRTNEVLIGKEKEYVYVSQEYGSDSYNGLTRNTPVKTLAHAIDIARDYGNIWIMDGTYSETNLSVDYELSIVGESDVILSGENNVFIVNNPVFSLINLTIRNAHRSTTTAQSNNEVYIKQLNSTGFIEIDGCSFISIDYKKIIVSQNAIDIRNSVFEDNIGTIIYAITLDMDNCSFIRNKVSNVALIDGINAKDWTISNSNFEDNYNLVYGVIQYSAAATSNKLNVINSSFIHNSVLSGSSTVYSSGIYMPKSCTVDILSSIFMNNFDRGSNANLINLGSKSTTTVRNSIFLNNTNSNNYGIVFGGRTALKNGVTLCDYNWFGNTMEDLTRPNLYEYIVCNNWLVLDINSNVSSIGVNQNALITAGVNKAVDSSGVISQYDAADFPSVPIEFKATNGLLNVSTVNLVHGEAQSLFTLNNFENPIIEAELFTKKVSVALGTAKVTPDISIEVDNVTYGNDSVIHIIWPEGSTIVPHEELFVRINEKPYEIGEYITLTNPSAGIYAVEVIFTGNQEYAPANYSKQFEVYKADVGLTIEVNNSYYGEDVVVDVYTSPEVTGDISIDINGKIETKEIKNGKASFIIGGLAADNYTVIANYSGNLNYSSSMNSANFSVRKYGTAIKVNYTVIDNKKIILDIEVTPQINVTVTLRINHNGVIEENLSLVEEGKLTYVIPDATIGDYCIDIIFDGDDKYLSSKGTVSFELDKVAPTISVKVNNIEYGQDAIVEITLNDDATGSVSVSVDGKTETGIVMGGKAEIPISRLSAGNDKKVEVFYSGDYNYLNASSTAYFNISKITPSIAIEANDIKLGNDVNVRILVPAGVTGTINVTCGDRKSVLNINPAMGLAVWKLENLGVENYTITAVYNGDGNYLTNETSATFKVLDWDAPQWANDGGDIGNTGKSPYETISNGEMFWFSQINGNISGNIVIDSEGNIYVTSEGKIYSFDKNGNERWEFVNIGVASEISGISISRDVIIAPKSGDTLYFVNQTDGTQFGHSNIYQGSSVYPPIVDENANVYIVSEYQYDNEGYNLVIVPYSIWENGGKPTSISLGKSKPVASPTIINNNLVAVACEDGLKIVNIPSALIVFSMSGNTNGVRPVVGPGNIVYAVLGDSIMAVDSEFNQIWKTKVSEGVGKCLVLDEEQGLFAINAKGNLYRYDLITGEETLISDLGFTSGILIGSDGKLYVGADKSFYALNGEGKELWKVDIGETIIGNPVMDSNGTIYLTSSNKIYALVNAPLKESGLEVTCQNITEGRDEIITVSLDSEATGDVTIKITGESYSNQSTVKVVNGEVIFTVSDLNPSLYNVEVQYCGDERFESGAVTAKFTVKGKKNTTVLISELSVEKFASQYKATLTDSDGHFISGVNLTLFVNGERHDAVSDINGIATFDLALSFGKYPLKVEFAGNDDYNPSEATSSITVMDSTSIQITAVYGDFRISSILKDSRGNGIANATIQYSLNNGERLNVVSNDKGEFTISIVDNCLVSMEFGGNELNKGSVATITIKNLAPKPKDTQVVVPTTMTKTAVDFNAGEKGSMFYFYLQDADGKPLAKKAVKIGIFDKIYTVKTDSNGRGGLMINIANANYYTYAISFLGDDDYKASFAVCSLQIVKKSVTITPAKTSYSFKTSAKTKTITATLKSTNSYIPKGKQVTLTIAGKTFKATIGDKGQINFNIGSITQKGTYNVAIKFAGTNTYDAATSKTITVKIT